MVLTNLTNASGAVILSSQPTNSRTPNLIGTGSASLAFTAKVDGSSIGASTVNTQGVWSIPDTKSLADGVHTLTLSYGSNLTSINTFTVWATPPTVTLQVPDIINAAYQSVLVHVASGIATTQVYIDIDLNKDGKFTGSELSVTAAKGPGSDYQLWIPTSIATGIYSIRARAVDAAGNIGTSAVISEGINFNSGIVGSQRLLELANGTYPIDPHSKLSIFTIDNYNRVLVGVSATSTAHMNNLLAELCSSNIGFIAMLATPAQNLITGYLPISAIQALPSLQYFNSVTEDDKPLALTGPITTQGDAVIGGPAFPHRKTSPALESRSASSRTRSTNMAAALHSRLLPERSLRAVCKC